MARNRLSSWCRVMAVVAVAGTTLGATVASAQPGAASSKRDPATDRLTAPAIVQLETRAGRVTIYAGALGRYYTIVTKDGRVAAERISGEELAANHPDVAATVDRGMAVQMVDLPQ